MLIHVKTFNDEILNSADYQTVLLNQHSSTTAKPIYLEQANADALKSGLFNVDVQNKILSIRIKNYANRQVLKQQLKQWFKRGTQSDLVVTFTDEGADYQLPCTVLQLLPDPDDPMVFLVTLQTAASAWRGVAVETVAPWEVTGTGESLAIAVAGYEETFLSLRLTATAGPASGYLHQNLYRLVNPPGFELGVIAYCITVDTQTLVSAGKMQADCDDLRIVDLNTGQELRRWITGANTTTTKVWVVLNFKLGVSLPLNATVANSGDVAYLQFKTTADVKAKIAKMEKSGIVYRGNEWFAYSNTDAATCRLTIAKRGLFGTTLSSHAVNDVFYYIQYPLVMKYGNATATNPALDDADYDDTKPLIDLANSSNAQWIWTASGEFYDPEQPNRACGWKFSKAAVGPESKVFTVKQDAESGDAAIGLKVASYKVGSTWKSETVKLLASFVHKAGITTASMTGDKYRSNNNWLSLAALQRVTGSSRVNLWTEAKPATAESWTSWTRNSVAVAANTYLLELVFSGGYAGAENAYAVFEALTCTLDFNSSNLPTGAFLGETDSYPLVITIENAANSDSFTLDYPMLLNKDFEIDGEARSVVYDQVNAHSAMTLNDESRSAFLRLVGGATNTISIAGTDVGTLMVYASYYRRRL